MHAPRPKGRLPLAAVAAFVLIAAGFGCNVPEFTGPEEIEKLQILAIRTDPAEPRPGDEVVVTGLAANPDGTPYDGYRLWYVAGGNLTDFADVDTSDPNGIVYLQEPGGGPFTFTMPDGSDFEEAFGPYDPAGSVLTVVMVVVRGVDSIEDALAGEGTQKIGYKVMVVSDRADGERNTNPEFNHMDVVVRGALAPQAQDGAYLVETGEKVHMRAHFDNAGGDRVGYSWFSAKDTEFDIFGTEDQAWQGPNFPEGDYYVYVVCRDNYLFESADGTYRIRSSGIGLATIRIRYRDNPFSSEG